MNYQFSNSFTKWLISFWSFDFGSIFLRDNASTLIEKVFKMIHKKICVKCQSETRVLVLLGCAFLKTSCPVKEVYFAYRKNVNIDQLHSKTKNWKIVVKFCIKKKVNFSKKANFTQVPMDDILKSTLEFTLKATWNTKRIHNLRQSRNFFHPNPYFTLWVCLT